MESSPVRRLLRGLDYSPAAEKRWRRLQQELRAAVERTEVSDLPSSVAAERLAALLDELAGLLDVARTRRRERARRAVTSALAALRRSPAPGQTLSGPLTELEERVETWLRRAQPEASRGRRRQLEKLLDDLVETRRRYALGWPLSGDAVTAFHAAAREHAGRYLDAAWMHTPELTAYALANLLASELARLMASPVTGESAAVAALRRIWAEVVSGRSDAGELRRRLRRLEAGGLSVDSLILPLLRIRPGAAATAGSLALEPCWELAGDGWPGRRQVARLLDSSDDLHLVLERLGYAPAVERRWPELWRELRGLISVEIPDFPALLGALDEIRGQLDETNTESSAGEAPDGEAADDPLRPARRAKRDDPLLRAVLAAGDDEPRVLAILAEDPVERVLPFIEEIPFIRDGEISWRMPVEIPLLRKRPRDGERFTELLDELDGLLDGPRTKRRQQARHEVTDAIARVKKALDRHDAYLPAPLKALEGKVVEWLYHAHSPVALERRRQLEELLRQLADARHRYGLDWPLEDADIGAFGDAAQEHARLYVEAEWMHAPWLTAYVLANLLASELAPRMTEPSTGSSEPVALLRRVWREAASGRFNRRESLRRLRQLEEGGIYVHSLAVALLRIEG